MAAKTDKTPRKTQSGAASLRARGLVGLPLSLTRGQRPNPGRRPTGRLHLGQRIRRAGPGAAGRRSGGRAFGKNLGKKEGKGIDSSDS